MSQVTGNVKWVLRIEGLSILLFALYIYYTLGFSWVTFGIYFFVPDLSFIGYLVSPKFGAIAYNCAHSLIGVCLVLGLSFSLGGELLQLIGFIWLAHIGFDRALGYGLKYSKGFGYTHLGNIGKEKNAYKLLKRESL